MHVSMVQQPMTLGTDNDPDKDSEHYGLWAFKRVWGTYLSEKLRI